MHLRHIWAIARKDALDLWLNKATMGGLLAPIILSLVYLLIGKVVGKSTTDILVYNPGNSNVSQVVVAAFSSPKVTQAGSVEEVTTAFGDQGTKAKTLYATGLIIPADFDQQLQSSAQPAMQLYFDEKTVSTQTQTLIKAAIVNYSRTIASPHAPVTLSVTVINQSTKKNGAFDLSKFYAPLGLLVSLIVGMSFMPQLLIEEKEKKTLRMLMVTPVSFEDVLVGKLLVVLVYQIGMAGIVLGIQQAFTGQVGLVILYAVLGGLFSVALGLLIGSVFNTVSAATVVEGPIMMFFILAGIFTGPMGQLLSNSPVTRIARIIPTYYIADGIANALQNTGTWGNNLLDLGVILGCTIALLAVSAWSLRRQSGSAGRF
jgi:ABC-2 type transport system permease protein